MTYADDVPPRRDAQLCQDQNERNLSNNPYCANYSKDEAGKKMRSRGSLILKGERIGGR